MIFHSFCLYVYFHSELLVYQRVMYDRNLIIVTDVTLDGEINGLPTCLYHNRWFVSCSNVFGEEIVSDSILHFVATCGWPR